MDDTDLLLQVAARDRAAYAELFARYAPRVAGFLSRSLPPARADDVAQDVMLKVWQKAPGFDPARASAATWIFAIARNARIDALRRASRAEPDADDPLWVPAAPPAPDESAERAARDAQVRAALRALPEAQVEVLERAYVQGQSLSEIADALSIPLGTVKSRVRLAMERLRAALAG